MTQTSPEISSPPCLAFKTTHTHQFTSAPLLASSLSVDNDNNDCSSGALIAGDDDDDDDGDYNSEVWIVEDDDDDGYYNNEALIVDR